MAYLAFLVGGLIICYLISRLLLRVFKSIANPSQRVAFSHLATLGIATLLGGFGMADGGAPRFGHAFAQYLIPVVLLAIVDFVRLARSRTAPPPQSS